MGRYLEMAKQVAWYDRNDRNDQPQGASSERAIRDINDLNDKTSARPAHPIDPSLATRVDAALRRGQWVRVATAFGDVILAPNCRAAERAAQRHPNLPIFQPPEWRELLACETADELADLIERKRTLGADLIRAEPVEREGMSP